MNEHNNEFKNSDQANTPIVENTPNTQFYNPDFYAAQQQDAQNAYGQPAQAPYGSENSYTQYGQSSDQNAYTQQPYGQQYNQQYAQQQYGQPMPVGQAQKSKIAAGLLGIFLGSLGVHNFYLGNTGKAVAQLLLTLIGWIIIVGPIISGIWALIEAILILCSNYGSPWHRDARGIELAD